MPDRVKEMNVKNHMSADIEHGGDRTNVVTELAEIMRLLGRPDELVTPYQCQEMVCDAAQTRLSLETLALATPTEANVRRAMSVLGLAMSDQDELVVTSSTLGGVFKQSFGAFAKGFDLFYGEKFLVRGCCPNGGRHWILSVNEDGGLAFFSRPVAYCEVARTVCREKEMRERLQADLTHVLNQIRANAQLAMAVEDCIQPVGTSPAPELGEYTLGCFELCKRLRMHPQAVAEMIAEAWNTLNSYARATASRGYVNFMLESRLNFETTIVSAIRGDLLAPNLRRSKRTMVEYSQPNTHKAFHVGHARCAVLGDTLVRLMEWDGDDVVAVNYLGDEGTHVARCLWYLQNHFTGTVPAENRGEFLGEIYVRATEMLDLASHTLAPVPGVVTARVQSVSPHPSKPQSNLVTLDHGSVRSVVVTVQTLSAGAVVAYASPGIRLGKRTVESRNISGVTSEGQLCSCAELQMANGGDELAQFPEGTTTGLEVAEHCRLESSTSVLEQNRVWMEEVSGILRAIERQDPQVHAMWQETRSWSLNEFAQVYRWLRCRFDHDFFESEFAESGKQLAEEYLKAGILRRSDGTIGADLGEHGLNYMILVKSDGTATYGLRDIALAMRKFREFKIDRCLNVVDSAQALHFKQVYRLLDMLGTDYGQRSSHIAYGQVVLSTGKMSSRKGNVILFSQLKRVLHDTIVESYLSEYKGVWDDDELELIAEVLAVATIRYGMLKQSNDSQIVFDLNVWSAISGNTGPYLIYTYARTRSLLVKANDRGLLVDLTQVDWSRLNTPEERVVIHRLYFLRSSVQVAVVRSNPHILCTAVYDLCRAANAMHAACPVLRSGDQALTTTRLAVHEAVATTLKAALELLGIGTVERM